MHVGRVVGEVVATVKHRALAGQKLLLVQPVTPEGRKTGRVAIAVDAVQAGPGDLVLVADEGNSAAQGAPPPARPDPHGDRWVVVDEWSGPG